MPNGPGCKCVSPASLICVSNTLTFRKRRKFFSTTSPWSLIFVPPISNVSNCVNLDNCFNPASLICVRNTLSKRSLVNGTQRLELADWSAAQLDWYKAQGCFTEIIRYQTRLFVPIEGAASVIARLVSLA